MVETNQLNIGWGTQDSVQLRDFSGWILWFMEDVTNYCENWMRLCQAHCQENKRNVPESPLLTARRGGRLCMQHPGPRNGAAILEAFPSSGNIAASFLGPVFGPIFGTTKEQTGAARRSWRPGFRPFAGASLPSAMQAAIDTHIRIILWGDMAQKLFWICWKGPLSGATRSHANLLRSGSVQPLQRLCQEAVLRASWEVCGVHLLPCIPSARFGIYYIVYSQGAKRDVIPYLHAGLRGAIGTYEGRNHRWEGRNRLFTCENIFFLDRAVNIVNPRSGRCFHGFSFRPALLRETPVR